MSNRIAPAFLATLALAACAAMVFAAIALGGRCGDQTCRSDMSVSGHAEPQPIRKGEKTELKITPKNDGPDGALAVDLQVDVPRQLKILGTRVHGGFGCNVSGTFVQCNMGDFARDQLGVVRIEVKGIEEGDLRLQGPRLRLRHRRSQRRQQPGRDHRGRAGPGLGDRGRLSPREPAPGRRDAVVDGRLRLVLLAHGGQQEALVGGRG